MPELVDWLIEHVPEFNELVAIDLLLITLTTGQ